MKQTLDPDMHEICHLYHFMLQNCLYIHKVLASFHKFGTYASRLWILKGLGKNFVLHQHKLPNPLFKFS